MTEPLPKVSIVLVTYKRTEEAVRTVRTTIENLHYPSDLLGWYVADDGSPKSHMDAVMRELKKGRQKLIGSHNQKFSENFHCGKGWNLGMGIAHQQSDFVLWLEDDWILEQPFDLTPYVRLLMENKQVGICSFRILSVGNEVETVGFNGIHYLQYMRTRQYAYSGNPYLRHARYTKHYGWFSENQNPGNVELDYDARYRADENGPWIWRPVGVDPWGVWHHIGTEKSYE